MPASAGTASSLYVRRSEGGVCVGARSGGVWFSLAFTCHPFTVGGKGGRTLWEARGAVWMLQRVPGV